MHVITNFEARAGAEGMLSRLLERVDEPTIVVSLRGIADHHRHAHPLIEYHAFGATGPVALARAGWRLVSLLRSRRPRAVMAWMYHAMAAAAVALPAARVPAHLVWAVRQSLDEPAALSRSIRVALRACRALSARPDAIAYNSRRAMELHAAYGFRATHATYVPNGFTVPPDAAPPEDARVFGIAGRLNPQKDHATFLRAAARVKGARFVAAGAGMEAGERVFAMFAEAGLDPSRIELMGEVSDMAAFYRSIDVLVLSSLTEGFPNVVAEAMLHARPVITTDVGDAAAIVADTGLVVPPGDADALAAAMRALRDDPKRARRMGAAARARAMEHYDMAAVAERYAALMR